MINWQESFRLLLISLHRHSTSLPSFSAIGLGQSVITVGFTKIRSRRLYQIIMLKYTKYKKPWLLTLFNKVKNQCIPLKYSSLGSKMLCDCFRTLALLNQKRLSESSLLKDSTVFGQYFVAWSVKSSYFYNYKWGTKIWSPDTTYISLMLCWH
jgi:hypothetical protein